LHSVSEELDQALDRLDPQTAALLEQTVRDAVALASKRVPGSEVRDALGYPVGYFEATAGGFQGERASARPAAGVA
jgi:hypothetical protein